MLSFYESDRPLALVKYDTGNKKNDIIYYHDSDPEYAGMDKRESDIKLSYGKMVPLPRVEDNQRQMVYVTGPSGSGKSVWTSQYIKMYHALFPKNNIIIISKKNEDPAYDQYSYVTRLDIDDSLLEGPPLKSEDFANSLIIFDDIENITPALLKSEVYRIKDDIIETGRSSNIYVVICAHLAMNGRETRKDLNETDTFVIFPQNSSHYHLKSLLVKYAGLDTPDIAHILKAPTRWVMIYRHGPRHIITENEAFLV
jgi:predicted AAA+ superfamily ATPase